jgi:hypothetical protein
LIERFSNWYLRFSPLQLRVCEVVNLKRNKSKKKSASCHKKHIGK